jgi:hypothetical protein
MGKSLRYEKVSFCGVSGSEYGSLSIQHYIN